MPILAAGNSCSGTAANAAPLPPGYLRCEKIKSVRDSNHLRQKTDGCPSDMIYFHAGQAGEQGYTLIEIILVIVIMSVMTMMIAPSFFSATGTTAGQEARRLTQALRLAADEAVLTGRPMRWTAREHSYSFESPDSESVWQLQDESPFHAYSLPGGIRILAVQPVETTAITETTDQKESEPVLAHLLLLPQGIVEPSSIVLADRGGEGDQVTILLQPGPAGISIEKEPIE